MGCDAAASPTPRRSGHWDQGEESAVQGGRSQRDDSAVHETANRRRTHKVGDARPMLLRDLSGRGCFHAEAETSSVNNTIKNTELSTRTGTIKRRRCTHSLARHGKK